MTELLQQKAFKTNDQAKREDKGVKEKGFKKKKGRGGEDF